MSQNIKYLKYIDMFSVPVETYIHDKNELKKGSIFGGILSIFCIFVSLAYIIFEINLIESGHKDIFTQ